MAGKPKSRCNVRGVAYEGGRSGTGDPTAEQRDGLFYLSLSLSDRKKYNTTENIGKWPIPQVTSYRVPR